ncbi:MAG: WG repeat-containing protein [Butyricicoccus sp.]
MKKQAAAMLLTLGLLCGCAPAAQTQTGETETATPEEQTAVAEQTPKQLTDYVEEGTALEAGEQVEGGIVPFSVGERYALANGDGEPVTDTVYDHVKKKRLSGQKEILWILRQGDQRTCVDEEGTVLLVTESGTISVLDDQYLCWNKEDGTSEIYSLDGALLTELAGQPESCSDGVLVSCDEEGNWYLTDTSEWMTQQTETVRKIGTFCDNYASVRISKKTWGLMDSAGSVIRLSGIRWMDEVNGAYVLAKDRSGQYGILNTRGQTELAFEYSNAQSCSEEAPIYQLWDENGECVVRNVKTRQTVRLPDSFDGQELSIWPNHYFSFTAEDGSVVLFDDLGKEVFDPDTELYLQQDNRMIACSADGYAVLNLEEGSRSKVQEGQYLVPKGIAAQGDSYFTVQDEETGLQGICDSDGVQVLPMEYDWIRFSGGNLFAVRAEGRSGLVDSKGNWVLCLEE